MRLLYLGDVVGRAGRAAITGRLAELRASLKADFVIVNAENATSGVGVSPDHARALLDAGADVLTLGDHAFENDLFNSVLGALRRAVRPAPLRRGGAYVPEPATQLFEQHGADIQLVVFVAFETLGCPQLK